MNPGQDMTMREGIILICTIVGTLGVAFVGAVKLLIRPIEVRQKASDTRMEDLIKNNTEAMMDIKTLVKEHGQHIQDHHVRIAVLETKHDPNGAHT